LKKQVEPVIEVENLLRQLRDGWAEMLKSQEPSHQARARGVA
jgi:flagellar protein FliS